MNAATWGIVVLVVFPLLQFPVIIYLARRVEAEEELPPVRGYAMQPRDPTEGDRSRPSSETQPSRSQPPPTRACPHCGIENANESAFTYCRDCLTRLR